MPTCAEWFQLEWSVGGGGEASNYPPPWETLVCFGATDAKVCALAMSPSVAMISWVPPKRYGSTGRGQCVAGQCKEATNLPDWDPGGRLAGHGPRTTKGGTHHGGKNLC